MLKLSSCGIDNFGMTVLSSALECCTKLQDLQLQRNRFEHEGALKLAKVVRGNSSIKTISLLGCNAIGEGGVATLLESMSNNRSVRKIFLPDAFEYSATSTYSQLATRVVWLPDIASQNVVKLCDTRVNLNYLSEFLVPGGKVQLINTFIG